MEILTSAQLEQNKCLPCEGGVEACSLDHAKRQLEFIGSPWELDEGGKRISRKFKLKNFAAAMGLLNVVADLAEQEQHHPDLHLTAYRLVSIELTTHAIGGLSENDFVLAAKIDALAGQFA